MDATIFALAIGVVASSLIVLGAFIKKSTVNYRLEAAEVVQDLRDRQAKRQDIATKVLSRTHFERNLVENALASANHNRGVVEEAERILAKGMKETK